MRRHARFRRVASVLLALALGGGALSVALSPAAQAAEPSDVSIRLPTISYSHMLVDQARHRVLITTGQYSSPRTDALLVYDFDGNLLKTVTMSKLDRPSGMALSEDGGLLYVGSTDYVLALNADTYASGSLLGDAHQGVCGREIATADGKAFYTNLAANVGTDCTRATYLDYRTFGLNGTSTLTSGQNFRFAVPQPGAPGLLLYTSTYGTTESYANLYDMSKAKYVSGRSWPGTVAAPALAAQDDALNADGSLVGLAYGAAGFRLLKASDMSDADPGWSAPPADASATAVAFSPDSSLVARGLAAPGDEADLLVQDADPAHGDAPRSFVFQDGADGGDRIASRGLAWSADASKLFAVTSDAAGDAYWLHIVSNAGSRYHASFQGPLTVGPESPYAGQKVELSGTIVLNGPASGAPARLTAVRTDASGSHQLDPVTSAADGSFTIEDTPSQAGTATYTVSYAGDAEHDPAADATKTVTVAKAPTTVALTAPTAAGAGSSVHIAGTLTTSGTALPQGTVVRVQRRTKGGAASLPTLRVAADGTFAFDDAPGPGDTLYTVDFNGDADHATSGDWLVVPATG
ncbi:Ig-like domain-containing protein [Streptomyces sp. NBC_00448]|uniref:Ig-like domain-containing protein n=1 Tax=Streptomyces sp. NBC_00448 TaxID=2903652 RepID=UPI002E21C790